MSPEINVSDYQNLAVAPLGDGVWTVTLNRAQKRNALDLATIEELIHFFTAAPRGGVRAVVLSGSGDHFCAGLDLIEHHNADRSPADFMHVCMRWHEAFNKMEYSGVPIIAALHGAVVGGGLELSSAAHIRVLAELSIASPNTRPAAIPAQTTNRHCSPARIQRRVAALAIIKAPRPISRPP